LCRYVERALQELEAGNAFAFATGKEARAKEREAAKAWREVGLCTLNQVDP
jgi:ATP-dependent RNA helicase DDX5/DBP2